MQITSSYFYRSGARLMEASLLHLLYHWFWSRCATATMVTSIVLVVASRLAVTEARVFSTDPKSPR